MKEIKQRLTIIIILLGAIGLFALDVLPAHYQISCRRAILTESFESPGMRRDKILVDFGALEGWVPVMGSTMGMNAEYWVIRTTGFLSGITYRAYAQPGYCGLR